MLGLIKNNFRGTERSLGGFCQNAQQAIAAAIGWGPGEEMQWELLDGSGGICT